MINEIKVDHTKPVFVHASIKDGGSYKRKYLFTFNGKHFCEEHFSERSNGSGVTAWDNIEFIKQKKLVQLDAKSCPRRPVLTHPVWGEGVEMYPSITVDGLEGISMYSWDLLFNGGYLINGLPASREVDE